jgi:hypothetical protein
MRVPVGEPLRVQTGDEVTLVAALPADASLARLFVFACDEADDHYSPYIPGVAALLDLATDRPQLLTPMMLRLNETHRSKQTKFTADFDGRLRVMQEVDRETDVRAKIKWRRQISPSLPFLQRLTRQLSNLLQR